MRIKSYCRYCDVYGEGHSLVCRELYLFTLDTKYKMLTSKIRKIKKLISDDINLETTT